MAGPVEDDEREMATRVAALEPQPELDELGGGDGPEAAPAPPTLGQLTKETRDGELAAKRRQWEQMLVAQRAEAESGPREHFRRASTVAVPLTGPKKPVLVTKESTDSESEEAASPAAAAAGSAAHGALTLARSRSWTCPRRAAAVEAIGRRQVRFRFSTAASVREAVREMHSLRMREFPLECCLSAERVRVRCAAGVWRTMEVEIDRDGLSARRVSTFRRRVKGVRISHDDIVAASLADGSEATTLTIHYMSPGPGERERRLRRRPESLALRFAERADALQWLRAVRVLVKWSARVPTEAVRRIKVVVNPHSGKRRGLQVWRRWQPLLELAGIECDVEETRYGGHARDMGASLDLSKKYEALVFVGGDGTVNEFMNGVLARPEREWRHLVATTPVSLLCAGTDNAFGIGVGTPSHAAAVFCILKRKIRPLDVMAVEAPAADGQGPARREFSCTGISWGIGSDIALESEATRWLGVYRYMFLKVKRGVLMPRRHECRVQYVLSDDVPTDAASGEQVLRTYFDMRDEDAGGQHHIEMCSVYDESYPDKQWHGDASAIFAPASEAKFAGRWREDGGQFTTLGASNVYFEAKYSHPSDGNLDLIYSRKGDLRQTADLVARYLGGDLLKAEVVGYHKIKALVIDPVSPTPLNVDGEVLPLPGPFRIEVVPQLLCVLSEK